MFVGRCAEHILKKHDYKNLLSVFIYASSMEERARRAMTVDHISQKEVYSYIAQKDRERKDYYYFHTGNDWGKMENYDLCLNTSALGYAGCAEIMKKSCTGFLSGVKKEAKLRQISKNLGFSPLVLSSEKS